MDRIEVLNHACVVLKGKDVVVYIDPFGIGEPARPADIVCITHPHYDHCSPGDIAACADGRTDIFAPADAVKEEVSGTWHVVGPGKVYSARGVEIETVPAYNTNKSFHPRAKGWVGYVVTVNGTRVYHAGDTDRIPEMREVTADVALLPVSGTYVMTAEEAAGAFRDIGASRGIPIHYGAGVVGTEDDARRFLALIGNGGT